MRAVVTVPHRASFLALLNLKPLPTAKEEGKKMIQTLLRLPSPKWESDLATGNRVIDNYLQRLDAGLVGAKSVRRVTLLEAREFLIKAIEQASPEDDGQAATRAAKAFGEPEDIACRQRTRLAKTFRGSMLEYGVPFAVTMLICQLLLGGLNEIGWLMVLIMFIVHGVFFGFFMALWATYGNAQSQPASIDKDETQGNFRVRHSRSSTTSGWFLIIVFSGNLSVSTLGLFSLGWFGDYNAGFNGLLALFSLVIVLKFLLYLPFGIDVTTQTIRIRHWSGFTEIPIGQVSALEKLPFWYTLPSFILGAGYRLKWLDKHGDLKAVLITLNGDLENADRFRILVEQAIESQKPSTDSTCKRISAI